MLELNKVHEYVVGKNNEAKIIRVRPALCFQNAGEPTIFVQDGKFWYEADEEPIDEADLPDWVINQLDRLTADARMEVGLPVPKDYSPTKGKPQVTPRRASIQKKNAAAEDSGEENNE